MQAGAVPTATGAEVVSLQWRAATSEVALGKLADASGCVRSICAGMCIGRKSSSWRWPRRNAQRGKAVRHVALGAFAVAAPAAGAASSDGVGVGLTVWG